MNKEYLSRVLEERIDQLTREEFSLGMDLDDTTNRLEAVKARQVEVAEDRALAEQQLAALA